MVERRGNGVDDGQRRRKTDIVERQEEFRLLRDQVLLVVGCLGVLGVGFAAVVIGIKDSAVALAALTVFATLLGAPTVLRLDEKRRNGNGTVKP